MDLWRRNVIALGVAATIGLAIPFGRELLRAPRPADAVDPFVRPLASLRPSLRVGSRVGIVLERDRRVAAEDTARWFQAQYALAPAFVRPVLVAECVARGPAACGAGQLDFLVTSISRRDALAFADELGFHVAKESGGFVLLARRQP